MPAHHSQQADAMAPTSAVNSMSTPALVEASVRGVEGRLRSRLAASGVVPVGLIRRFCSRIHCIVNFTLRREGEVVVVALPPLGCVRCAQPKEMYQSLLLIRASYGSE